MKKIKEALKLTITLFFIIVIGGCIGNLIAFGTMHLLSYKLVWLHRVPKIGYYSKVENLSQQCWSRALWKLYQLQMRDDIIGCDMIAGYRDGKGHAWISYTQRIKERTYKITYDPTFGDYVEIKEEK